MGATIIGPAVLTVEYEPVPRGFAFGLALLAIGLMAQNWYLMSGLAWGWRLRITRRRCGRYCWYRGWWCGG